MSIAREHVEAIACCLVREYLFRKSQEIQGLQDVLFSLEKAFPRSPQCFQQRDQLIRAVFLEKAAKENKIVAASYRSLIEILVADRLEKRRLKNVARNEKEGRPDREQTSQVLPDKSTKTISAVADGPSKETLPLEEARPDLRDRTSLVVLPAKATTSILASDGRFPIERRSTLRRGSPISRLKEKLPDKDQDGLSSSDEDTPLQKTPIEPTDRERPRPQSARIRHSSAATKTSSVNRDEPIDLQRRKSAWSHLTRTAKSQVVPTTSPTSPVNPMAPLSPAMLPITTFATASSLHNCQRSNEPTASNSNATGRLTQGSSSSASALLEKTDNILRKKAAQRPPSRSEEVTLEDLSELHDDHGPVRTDHGKGYDHRKITFSENEQLQKLLFGESSRTFGEEWIRQSLEFCREDSRVAYGLRQSKGGPCGVLAVTQAYLFKHLLWPGGKSGSGDMSARLQVTESSRKAALMRAIHEILVQAGCDEVQNATSGPVKTTSGGPFRYVMGKITASSQRTAFTSLTIYNLPDTEQLLGFLTQHQDEILRNGVVHLLISVLLCRGMENIRQDMDSPEHCLIGRHNHTTQEVVNLMLTGRAASNLFDNRLDVEGTILKGVQQQSICGLLSLVEAYGIIEVGSYLKNPRFPIWVLISENHYFVLFGTCLSVLESSRPFELFVYDGLANAESATVVKVDPGRKREDSTDESNKNPIELCVRTKWKLAHVEVIED